MSGVIDNYWAMSVENDHLELAHKIATELGEPKNTYDELVGFLKAAPADKLSAYSTVLGSTTLFEVPFAPVIESESRFSIYIFLKTYFGFQIVKEMIS